MTNDKKRLAGIAVAALALAGGAFGSIAVHRYQERTVRRLSEKLADSARGGAREWLAGKLQSLEGQAAAAASLSPIKSNVITFDAPTLKDGFRSEPWWEPFRREFTLYGLAVDGDKLDALEGMDLAEFDAGELIRKARGNRQASLFLRAGARAWPYAAAAAVVDLPRPLPAVLVLARAVDQSFAQEMSDKLGGAVMLSDGKEALLLAGPEAERGQLKEAVGKESMPMVDGEDGSWAASPSPLLPGLTLWTYATIGKQAEEFRDDSRTGSLVVWCAAGLVALLALILGFRGQDAPAGSGAPEAEVTASAMEGAYAPGQSGTSGRSGTSGQRAGLFTPTDTGLNSTSGSSDPAAGDPEGATAVQKAPRAPAGNVFGRYVLLDRLGEGGMAEIYTAVAYGAENFRRTFVVKRLRAEMLRNNDVVSAFIDEANLASSLVHSNIVPVFDFGKVGDEYFLAQEYILGRDLGRVNRRAIEREQKPLPMALVFFVVHEVLEALDYAHNRTNDAGKPMGIVHRDCSPNNILVSARGEVKLFDFGIAKAEGRITQTQFGMVKGNVRFMSPEQARGEPVDGRSDLFAMGLVLYYALSGDALYRAETAYNLLVKAAQGPGGDELANLASLPKEAQRILERALQPNVADRFQTAAEFAAALAPFINGQQGALARTMDKLFGEDIQKEQAHFAAAAAGNASPGAPAAESEPEGGTSRFAAPKS